jgi:uncharacterized protein (DUF4213/DUF364 family)
MSIVQEYIEIAEHVAAEIDLPKIARLYLPDQDDVPDVRDEFGLIFLQGGVVAPFYASLPGTLNTLWKTFKVGRKPGLDLLELIRLLADSNLANKAIALGAYNAMSQYVMRHAGLLPLYNEANASMGSAKPRAGERIGMIGYFCPLIDKLLDKGVEILVLEKQPERVEQRPGVYLSENPADLESCRIILCTAATLINDSIDEILAHCQNAENVSLIGPSGSGLPDVLFKRGVDAVGGVYFPDQKLLGARLRDRESWGELGQKYNLTPDTYPGLTQLLDRVHASLKS